MTQPIRILWCVVFAASLFLSPTRAAAQSATTTDSKGSGPEGAIAHKAKLADNYGRLPLSFETNAGQTDPRVQFLSHAASHTLFLTSTEAVLGLNKKQDDGVGLQAANYKAARETESLVLRMRLLGANPHAVATGLEQLPGKSNYFIGNNPANWHSNVSTYSKVRFSQVYPGIDLVYYGNQRELEYDFAVEPGADTSRIRLAINGANKVFLDANGDAVLHSAKDEIHLRKPVLYQEVNGKKVNVRGEYVLRGRELTFRISDYDHYRTLIIDPVLSYSTYLGGINSDGATGVAVDSGGNAYVVGATSFGGFPVTSGVVQPTIHGSTSVFIAKLNAAGTALVYSTYLGGSGQDTGYAIAVDPSGSAYVTGATISSDFPITSGAFQSSPKSISTPGSSAFVTKLSPDGSSLAYSTYLGGNANDSGFAIAVDASGSAYVAGETQSGNFPVRGTSPKVVGGPISCDSLNSGGFDGFITKFSPAGDTVAYSLFLGGSGTDVATGVAVDSSRNAYVAGYTTSKDFLVFNTCPGPGPGATSLQPANAGTDNGFIVKVSPDGLAFLGATYLGGSGQDAITSIAVDASGFVYLAGEGNSGGAGGLDAFGAKLDGSLSSKVYFNYVGGSGFDRATGVALDSTGNAYLVGQTASTNFPQVSPLQPAFGGGTYDAFVTELNPNGGIVFSTYLGGSGDEGTSIGGYPIAVDSSGNVYVAGSTTSTDFPGVTSISIQPANGGGSDAFIVALSSPPPNTFVGTNFSVSPIDSTTGTSPVTLTFSNVTKAGYTSLATSSTGPTIPTGFLLNGVYYNLATTAQFTGTITICITSPAVTSSSQLWHFGSTGSSNITSSVNPPTICGTSSSLSPFAILQGAALSSTSTGLSVSPNPAASGQLVTFTSGVSSGNGTGSGGPAPTGSVTFFDGATALAPPVNLPNNGPAMFTISALAAGMHTITAQYSGDGNYVASTSPAVILTVNLNAASPGLLVSPNPAAAGQLVTLSSSVLGATTGTGIPGPTGSVTFLDGGTPITSPVNLPTSGPAMLSIGTLAAGMHVITAQYNGDANYGSGTSGAVTLTVNKSGSSIGLSTSPNPSAAGQLVTFTSGVTGFAPTGTGAGDAPPPGGSVAFFVDAAQFGTPINLPNSGSAMTTISTLTPGTHTITAQYSGDGNYLASTSQAVIQTVNNSSTTTTISAAGVMYGTPASVTVSVGNSGGTVGGSVSLSVDGGPVSIMALTNGSTVFNLGVLNAGPHTLSANFAAQGSFSASSGTGSLSVTQAPLTVTANNATRSYGAGNPSFSGSVTGIQNGDNITATYSSSATTASPVGSYDITPTLTDPGNKLSNYAVTRNKGTLTITAATVTITANNATKTLSAPNPTLSWTASGLVNGDNVSVLTINPICNTTAGTTSPVGSYAINCSGANAANYTFSYVPGTLKIVYAPNVGRVIQAPINADGTSVFNQGRTIPAKFSVYDSNGVSIGTPGVISSFYLTGILSGTTTTTVENVVDTNNPDTYFRWDATSQQWIFNINTGNLTAGSTYVYTITLNDGSTIVFQYGLR